MTILRPQLGPAWLFYVGFYRGHSRPLIYGLLAATAQTVFALPLILLVRLALDDVVPSGELFPLLLIGFGMLGLYAVQGALFLLARYIILTVTKTAVRSLRHELLETLYRMPRAAYAKADLRQTHTRMVEDSERVDVMSNALLIHLLPSIPPAIVLCAALLYLNPLLFSLILIAAPILVISGRRLRRAITSRVQEFHAAFEGYSRSVHHSLHLLDLIRSHATEDLERGRHADHTACLRSASRRMAFLQEAHNQLHYLLLAGVAVFVLMTGGYAVSTGLIGLGDLGAFLVALALLRTHLQAMAGAIPQIIAGERALESLYDLVSMREPPLYRGQQRIEFRGSVRLQGVEFSYQRGHRLLGPFDLELTPGRVLALSGHNGSGKTTLAHLVLGLYRPEVGSLAADGIPYDSLDLHELRRQIGYAPQRPLLFPGTIAENLRYASPEADPQTLIAAAQLAGVDRFIASLPQGYESRIGDGGMGLSGGQQQRLGLARALLKRPRLLLLDEPSSNLDAQTAQAVLAGLRRLDPAPAILVISHDPRVLEWADEVLWLEQGRLSTYCTEVAI